MNEVSVSFEAPKDLSIGAFLLLQILDYIDKSKLSREDTHILELETKGYIRIVPDDIILTDKWKLDEKDALKFEDFWNKYHSLTKLAMTDKEAAKKHWNKLKTNEKKLALDETIITNYVNYVKSKQSYFNKARTYLSDKLFNNQYSNIEISVNRM